MEPQRNPGRGATPSLGDVMETVEAALRNLDFGSIVLKVHDGQVVSIETSRKLRLAHTR
jgi:hypothetical protein